MGVRGLTTFIAQNSDRYLKRYELHDCYLVVDGNNLAAQLYKWHTKCYDCFGGDYDKYAKTVVIFFNLLRECNVTPLIVFDGGYEDKKLKTVFSRVKTRIKQTRMLNSATENSMTVFPLFLRELFVEIILKHNLKVVRCLVEADFEMACIARKLSCPLLSYDSDFYIFDVEYIPFNTLILNSVKSTSNTKYKYLDCQVYKVDYFLKAYGGLKKECIPLLGVLLGNDYIHINVFRNFYKQLKKCKNKPGCSDQQRRIKSLIAWLQNETFESAFRKILGRTKQIYRQKVAQQILSATNNYICTESELLKYLNLDVIFTNKESPSQIELNIDNIDYIESDDSDLSEESENEEIESSGSDIDILIKENNPEVPKLLQYFEDKYRRCLYPTCFIDMILHNRYIFVPVIEDYSKTQCHHISLNILSAIYKILRSSDENNLKYILRNENGQMRIYEIPPLKKALPTLGELENITFSQSLKYMSDVLELNENFLHMLNEFPPSWRLYIISVIYWIKNAEPHVNECYVYALLLSAIVIKTIGLDYCRNESKFLKRYQKNILNIQSNPIKSHENINMTANQALDSVTSDDMIMIMKEIIVNFDMIIKMRRNPRLFDCSIIHMFAEFQSCAYHIKYLNTLLNNPFEDYLISDFYNGTLIYNLSSNLLSRPQSESYLKLLMKSAPNVYNAFVVIRTYVTQYVSSICVKNIVSRRRKKHKKKECDTHTETDIIFEDDETLYDVNNRFGILSLEQY